MSAIVGKGIISAGGGGELNIAYGLTPPADTSKLWVRMQGKPSFLEVSSSLPIPIGETVENVAYNPMPTLLNAHSQNNVVQVGNKLYVFVYPGNVFEIYNLSTNEWTQSSVRNVGTPFYYAGYAVVDTKIYCFGGWNATSSAGISLSQCLVYDTETDTWTSKNSAPTAGRWGYYYRQGSILYMIAYSNNSIIKYDIENDLYSYDTSNWTFTKNIYGSAWFAEKYAGIWVNNFLYLIPLGNDVTLNGTNCMIWRLNFDTKQVEQYSQMKPFLSGTAFSSMSSGNVSGYANVSGALYIFCCSASSNVVGSILKITPDGEGIKCETLSDKLFDTFTTSSTTGYIAVAAGVKNSQEIIVIKPHVSGNVALSSNITSWVQKLNLYSTLNEGYLIFPVGSRLVTFLVSKDVKISSNVSTPVIGNAQSIAENVDAYLYDTTKQNWISLDGTPYTA